MNWPLLNEIVYLKITLKVPNADSEIIVNQLLCMYHIAVHFFRWYPKAVSEVEKLPLIQIGFHMLSAHIPAFLYLIESIFKT